MPLPEEIPLNYYGPGFAEVIRELQYTRHFLLQRFSQLENAMTVRTDALVASVQPLTDAVHGLVTIVSDEPRRIGEAVSAALAAAQVADDQSQVLIDQATAASEASTAEALAAAQANTGTTLPPPVEQPPAEQPPAEQPPG